MEPLWDHSKGQGQEEPIPSEDGAGGPKAELPASKSQGRG